MTDQSDKPKLGTRPPLGLKRTVETGKVKQSFSHGRSNTVVVEVKKRRILGKPGEAPAPVVEAPAPVVAAPAPAPRAAPAPTPAQRRPADDISSRRELQERLLREAGDEPGLAKVLVDMGNAKALLGRTDEAKNAFEQAADACEKQGDVRATTIIRRATQKL